MPAFSVAKTGIFFSCPSKLNHPRLIDGGALVCRFAFNIAAPEFSCEGTVGSFF